MSPIEKQKEIITQLASLVYNSAVQGYEEASCIFRYQVSSDGSSSVDTEAWYVRNGERKSVPLIRDKVNKPIVLVPKLHELMFTHTGGDWTAFILTLDKDGKATTKFKYK